MFQILSNSDKIPAIAFVEHQQHRSDSVGRPTQHESKEEKREREKNANRCNCEYEAYIDTTPEPHSFLQFIRIGVRSHVVLDFFEAQKTLFSAFKMYLT